MKVLKYLLYTLTLLVGLFITFIIYSTLTNYTPAEKEILFESEEITEINDSVFDAMIWNIGYAGLDQSMDFFFDGGRMVRPEKEKLQANIKGILETLEDYLELDFVLLQEVDRYSKRSYRQDICINISNLFEPSHSIYTSNFRVNFIPIPLKAPMGRVESGLHSISAEIPGRVTRFSYPGNYAWPKSVFMLDRCFIESRLRLTHGKELIVINTHKSAYDDGSLRQQQMDFMKEILLAEYNAGNYVIVGGDWNQIPHAFTADFDEEVFDTEMQTYVEESYPAADWTWAYDAKVPTNRSLKAPYLKGETACTVIDCFLLSPNIEVLSVKGIELDFEHSDHQPVAIRFKIK